MAESVLERIRRFNESQEKRKSARRQFGPRLSGIFHKFADGDNIIRLIGGMVEVNQHFIAPVPKRKERGLCQAEAFQGERDERLPQVVNCWNWDVVKEEAAEVKTCPLCRLNAIASQALREGPTAEEKKFFEWLESQSFPRTALKWNILDRDNPWLIQSEEDGTEVKVLGMKIASIGMEAWTDIKGIFEQCKIDITDPNGGIDICVTKGNNGARTCYSAQAVIEGVALKVTPLTDEERELPCHDLKAICGKMVDVKDVIDALHGDLRQILELNAEEAQAEAAPPPSASKSAAKPAAKSAASVPSRRAVSAPADEDVGDEDDGGLIPSSDGKKK